jgi:SAM-dependent methyltransferase
MEISHGKGLHFNHRYVLDFAARRCAGKAGAAILDYGCGSAETVVAGRKRGLNMYGADVFYMDGAHRNDVVAAGLFGDVVREIKDGRADFPNQFFDFISSNQVMEHVVDLDEVLREIHRLLKPGGTTLHLFPSKDVWREGHCGVPFVHWFPKDSALRYQYTLFMRRAGLGKYKRVDHPAWTQRMLAFQDGYCFYRSRKEIFGAFRKYFDFELIEDHYTYTRLQESRWRKLAPLTQWPLTRALAKEAFRKLGGLVILATKKPESVNHDNRV